MIMDDDHTYLNALGSSSSSFRPPNEPGFEVSDFFEFGDWVEDDPSFSSPFSSPASAASYNPQGFSYSPNAGSGGISSSFLEGAVNSKLDYTYTHIYTYIHTHVCVHII